MAVSTGEPTIGTAVELAALTAVLFMPVVVLDAAERRTTQLAAGVTIGHGVSYQREWTGDGRR